MTDLASLAETYTKQFQAMKDNLSFQMKEAFKTFFENNPDTYAIGWIQYTPYFNDGEECIFGVHDFYPITEDDYQSIESGDKSVWDCDLESEYKYGDKKGQPIPEWFTKAQEFRKVLYKVDKDIFKTAFGDHVQVIATRKGFDVTEWEHD